MLIRRPPDIPASEITDPDTWRERRRFLAAGTASLAAALAPGAIAAGPFRGIRKTPWGRDEELTPLEKVTAYNNFYEFGTDKRDPARYAHLLRTEPWTVSVGGECERPGTYGVEDLVPFDRLEERIYRLRCVEAWSMVIPWVGVPLAPVIKRMQPTSKAKYVEFVTLLDPEQMPGQRRDILPWPYREGLRIDEATHPLTLLAVGLYGEVLPKQSGAPIRLVVPWKYGFKSIKSIVAINFTEQRPRTTWNQVAPREYGFYANVNPEVDHPRWSQRKERRIGDFFKRPTEMFNGYAEQVASLYAGMDLRKDF